jgi:tetratricopeptide (TPR) repeat protein
MSYGMRIFAGLAIGMAILAPVAVAQKPPAPAPQPQPPSSAPGRSASPSSPNSDPRQSTDLVMFLRGRIATQDGTNTVPNDMLIERVCNNRVRQQVYASLRGDFSMQLGSKADSFPEASVEPVSPYSVAGKDSLMGIPRHDLTNCELRVSASGFYSRVVALVGLDAFGSSIDVGVVVVQRATKTEGATVNAALYKAPKDARKAYEKGLEAEKNGRLADAHKYFETAVEIFPSSANAWFQLGTVLQKQNQKDAARQAYTRATDIDTKFAPPYLSLASMAYETENWADVVALTDHILDLDPWNHAAANGYILDLDRFNYADAYFYNAVANFKLNKIEAAEKSGLKAEHVDLRPRFPQLHLLLADIFVQRNKYAMAISELQTYLELVPHAKNADHLREQLAELEKLNDSAVKQ